MTNTLYDTDGTPHEQGFEVLMTPKDAAAILAISVRTLTKYAGEGKIRFTKTEGGHRRYFADSIRAAHAGRWDDAAVKPDMEDMNLSDVSVVIP